MDDQPEQPVQTKSCNLLLPLFQLILKRDVSENVIYNLIILIGYIYFFFILFALTDEEPSTRLVDQPEEPVQSQ